MPNADVLLPIQRAIYTRCTSDTQLMDLVTGVFDQVPEDIDYPYVEIGEATQVPEGAHDRFGARVTVTLHIWSTYHGYSDALTVLDHLVRLFDHQPLTIAGHHDVSVRLEQTMTMRDPDPDIRHVPCRFAITTEHAA